MYVHCTYHNQKDHPRLKTDMAHRKSLQVLDSDQERLMLISCNIISTTLCQLYLPLIIVNPFIVLYATLRSFPVSGQVSKRFSGKKSNCL